MKYIANPIEVDAFRIKAIYNGKHFLLEDGQERSAGPAMLSRITPHVGDYWVIQSDGYVYLNPKDVFERKYHPDTLGGS